MSKLCVVIPVFNEEENVQELITRLLRVFDSVPEIAGQVVFVNDGSRDGTVDLIVERCRNEPRIALIDLSRNFGHQAALSAGLAHADGDAVVTMDADLQDPPELIPDLMARWRQGYEVVYAVRRRRKEAVLKRLAYSMFYRLQRAIAKIDLPLDAGDFCLMDRRVVEVVVSLPEYNRFLRGLRGWVGFRQTGLEYDRPARFAGETKYSWSKLLSLAVSGFVGFSTLPLRAAVWLGLLASAFGLILMVWVVATKVFQLYAPRGWASMIAVVLFLGGVQLLVLGVMGEYLGNVYDEVRRRPVFVVRRLIGFDRDRAPTVISDRQTAGAIDDA